jgi:triacylglycerol lipase
MLSRLLLSILVLEAVGFAAFGVWLSRAGYSIWAAVLLPLVAYLLWRALIPALSFGVSGVWRRVEAGGKRARLRATVEEVLLTVWLYSAAHPFSRWFRPRPQPGEGPVLVLVHGFFCNGGMWGGMAQRLARAGYPRVHAVDLDPLYRDMQASLADFHAKLGAILDAEGEAQAVLVGHSMGGVLVRLYRRLHPERVALAVAIGAPHYGTRMSHWVGAGERGPATPRTQWLAAANASHDRDAVDAGLVNIWSEADNIVAPQENARLPGVEEHRLTAHGHLRLALAPETFQLLLAALVRLKGPAGAPE